VRKERSSRLHYLDCSPRFLSADQKSIDASLMPDALHPSVAGYKLLIRCLSPLISRLL